MTEIDQYERLVAGLKELVKEMKGLPFPYSPPLSSSDEMMAVMIGIFGAVVVLVGGVLIAAVMF